MIIQTHAFPRAALIGNPSDGYYGKTIAFVFSNFRAEIILYESPELEIVPQDRDKSVFTGIEGLYDDVRQFGYYGGIRLIKAAIKKFFEYTKSKRVNLAQRNFTLRYESNIPQRLGLAGSSAIITACMRAMMKFYNIEIPPPILANIVLSVETEELGLGAGLQDRVAQAYEAPVYMDFDKVLMERQGFGQYKTFEKDLLPPIFLAFRTDLSEGSEVLHNNLKERFNRGDQDVLDAMRGFASITNDFMKALEEGDHISAASLMNDNFDLRASITQISKANMEMVNTARAAGASAKFTGSGGAIIGTYKDEQVLKNVRCKLEEKGIKVIIPDIVVKSRKGA